MTSELERVSPAPEMTKPPRVTHGGFGCETSVSGASAGARNPEAFQLVPERLFGHPEEGSGLRLVEPELLERAFDDPLFDHIEGPVEYELLARDDIVDHLHDLGLLVHELRRQHEPALVLEEDALIDDRLQFADILAPRLADEDVDGIDVDDKIGQT